MTVAGAPRVAEGDLVFVFLHDGQPTHFAEGLFHVRMRPGWVEPSGTAVPRAGSPVVQAPISALIDAAGPLLQGG